MELNTPPIPFDFHREDMKIYAVMLACSIVANDNGLTPKQQIEIYNPAHWNDSPGQNLDNEFEAFKRCGSQGLISITEKFDHELANEGWYSKHLTFKNKEIIIDPDHIGFTSNQSTEKQFIKPPVYIEKKLENTANKNYRNYIKRPSRN